MSCLSCQHQQSSTTDTGCFCISINSCAQRRNCVMFRGVSILSSIRNSGNKPLTARSIQPYRIPRIAFSTAEDADTVQLKIEYKNMADGLILGDRACLARLITLIESQRGKYSSCPNYRRLLTNSKHCNCRTSLLNLHLSHQRW